MYKLRRKLIPVLQASLEMFNTGSLFFTVYFSYFFQTMVAPCSWLDPTRKSRMCSTGRRSQRECKWTTQPLSRPFMTRRLATSRCASPRYHQQTWRPTEPWPPQLNRQLVLQKSKRWWIIRSFWYDFWYSFQIYNVVVLCTTYTLLTKLWKGEKF